MKGISLLPYLWWESRNFISWLTSDVGRAHSSSIHGLLIPRQPQCMQVFPSNSLATPYLRVSTDENKIYFTIQPLCGQEFRPYNGQQTFIKATLQGFAHTAAQELKSWGVFFKQGSDLWGNMPATMRSKRKLKAGLEEWYADNTTDNTEETISPELTLQATLTSSMNGCTGHNGIV